MLKKYIIYKITNNMNGKQYIGRHVTDNINDGYMGSGVLIRAALKKYGRSCFTKEILAVFNNFHMMNLMEASLVDLDYINRSDTYNLQTGGSYNIKKSSSTRKKHSKAMSGSNHWNWGKYHSLETKAKIGDRDYSMNSKPETCFKISEGLKRTIASRPNHWSLGQPSARKGLTLIEEQGPVNAYIIRTKIKISAANRVKKTCIYCDKTMDASNLGRYHNENCIHHKDKKIALENQKRFLVICPYCGKEGSIPTMRQWHFDKCKRKNFEDTTD